ncbi:MAG: glutathione S-transferase family protein [Thermoplasmata archaeon]|nr:glutathione S-transferase family protein [Thermoplasmata archaeon]
MAARPTLFTMEISHYCVSAERMLAFKGIRPRLVRVPYHDKQALIRATGQDYVPALKWGDEFVAWNDIPRWLDRKSPRPLLFPPGQEGLAETLENWGHQVLEERVWRAVVTQVPPMLADDHERWVFEEMQSRARGPFSILALRQPEFRAELEPYLALLDRMLDGRAWVLGEPSVADFGIYGGLSPFLTVGERLPAQLPNLRRWVARIQKLPG